jgi:hypothetical protein
VLSPNVRWFLQRVALLDSPLLMIAAIASILTDRPILAIVLALGSFALYLLGRPVLGRKYPPSEEERRGLTPLETQARPAKPARPRRRRDFKGF